MTERIRCRSCDTVGQPHRVFPYLCVGCCAGLDKWLIDLDEFGKMPSTKSMGRVHDATLDVDPSKMGRAATPLKTHPPETPRVRHARCRPTHRY